jgi:hypothetical protein
MNSRSTPSWTKCREKSSQAESCGFERARSDDESTWFHSVFSFASGIAAHQGGNDPSLAETLSVLPRPTGSILLQKQNRAYRVGDFADQLPNDLAVYERRRGPNEIVIGVDASLRVSESSLLARAIATASDVKSAARLRALSAM